MKQTTQQHPAVAAAPEKHVSHVKPIEVIVEVQELGEVSDETGKFTLGTRTKMVGVSKE